LFVFLHGEASSYSSGATYSTALSLTQEKPEKLPLYRQYKRRPARLVVCEAHLLRTRPERSLLELDETLDIAG
jgi:hypothetical protein